MTREEIDYLEEYLKAVQAGADVTDGVKEAVLLSAMAGDADAKHRLIEIFLPQVAEIAKLYAGQGVFSGRPDWRRQCGADDGGRDAGLCTECQRS